MWTTLPRSKLSNGLSAYRSDESGPRLLLIHGVGMHADYWSNLTPALEQQFSLTVVDMPGHGQSPVISSLIESDTPALQDYTDVIAQAVLGDAQHYIAGHSMGALIALDMAVRYADHVAGIAVLNGVYRRTDKAQQAILARAAQLSVDPSPDPEPTLQRWFGVAPEGNDARAASSCRNWLQAANHEGYATAYKVFAASDAPADSDLKTIHSPTVFMTGSDEPNSTPEMSRLMSALVPDSQCVIVNDARHMMSMTHGELVGEVITEAFIANREAK